MTNIGIATFYNNQQHAMIAINAILNQSQPLDQIYLIDDASTDCTFQILMKFSHLQEIKIIRNKTNLGPSATRNIGLVLAQATFSDLGYIFFFDGDDISCKNRVKEQLTLIEHSKGKAICLVSQSKTIYMNEVTKPTKSNNSKINIDSPEILANFLLTGKRTDSLKAAKFVSIQTSTMCINSEVIKKNIFFDEKLRRNEDSDFAIKILLEGGILNIDDSILVLQNSTEAKYKNALSSLEGENFLLQKWGPQFLSRSEYSFAKNWNQMRFYWFSRKILKTLCALIALTCVHPTQTIPRFLRFGLARIKLELSIYFG